MFAVTFEEYLREKAGLSAEEVNALGPFVQRKKFEKGSFALRQGEICADALFVERGLLRFYSIDESGKEHIVQFAPENWFIADRGSIYFKTPSDYFIDAVEDSYVVFLKPEFMCLAAEQTRTFAQYNEQILQKHIMQLQKRVRMLIGASALERYLDFIETYHDLMLRVPQWMIASYLGITPESLSRVRKELAKKHA
jgi:CRP-like cAMP-binding protein